MSASFDQEPVPQRQLGELMTGLGMITEEQLATVLEVQRQSKRPLGQIIVELGFASGAAVAHALALQRGGALKTEHGFALGVGPADHRLHAESDSLADIPRLRLAPSAIRPAAKRRHAAATDPSTSTPRDPTTAPAGRRAALAVVPPAEPEPDPLPEQQAGGERAPAAGIRAAGCRPRSRDYARRRPGCAEDRAAEAARGSGGTARGRARRSADARADSGQLQEERDRVAADLEQLRAARSDAEAVYEQELSLLGEERDRAAAELDRVQATLDRLLEAGQEPLPALDPGADARETTTASADILPRTETAPPDDPALAEPATVPHDVQKAAGGLQPGSTGTVAQYHAALRHVYEQAGLDEPAPPSLADVRVERDPTSGRVTPADKRRRV